MNVLLLQAATLALSAIINALYETNYVAIVRRVYANDVGVKLGVLVPHIKATYEVRLSHSN